MVKSKILLGFTLFFILVQSCLKDKVGANPTPYILKVPSHFPKPQIPSDNPMTEEGVLLGRILFYDKQLSQNNTISCGSCHSPNKSFSDSTAFSFGVTGAQGTRNSMPLFNLAWQKFFFWDGRTQSLEEQILEPVPNPIEMHLSWQEAIERLNQSLEYRNAFYRAFGVRNFDKTHVSKAIAQFLRTLISGASKYDVIYKYSNSLPLSSSEQTIWNTVTSEELAGFDLFKSLNGADCFHCHNGPLMQVQKFSNNGLDASFLDLGYGLISGNSNDNGKFKVPSLRNIGYTAPYMHDGRFSTIEEVIDHYSTGISLSPTIDPLIEFGAQGGVQLDQQEKDLIKAFLETLNDPSFVTNPDFLPLK